MYNTPKAFFAVAFVIHCVLWSQSRYAQPSHNYQPALHRKAALWKRTPFTPSPFDIPVDEEECLPLDFEFPSDQCIHVRDQCPTPNTVLSIHYLQLYFCADPSVRPLIFTAFLLWLAFLFSTLGISASDFFTPNLAAIAQFLGLNEDIAGVTLLAFGNASPDVFATFSAMRANSGSLAVGELLGAATFIVSCVVGSMCIIRPFKVDRIPFLRDVGFFTIAIGLLLVILHDGMISAFESMTLVAWYVCYAFTVIVGGWWASRREQRRRIEATIRAEYMDETPPQPRLDGNTFSREDFPSPPSPGHGPTVPLLSPIPIRTRSISAPTVSRVQTQLPPAPPSHTPSPITSPSYLAQMPSFSLVGAIEFRQVVASLQSQAASSSLNMFDSPVTPYPGGHYHTPRRPSRSSSVSPHQPPESEEWDRALGVPLNDRSPKLLRTSILEEPQPDREEAESSNAREEDARTPLTIPTIPSISHTPASPTEASALNEVEEQAPLVKPQAPRHVLARTWHILFPSLHDFKSKTLLGKVVSLLAVPAVMALTLTLPVVMTPYGSDGSHHEKMDRETPLIELEEAERTLVTEHEVQEELREVESNKWLTAVQCILGPLFCVTVLFNGSSHTKWLLAGTALGGSVLASLVLAFPNVLLRPAARMVKCSMGFLVSVVWIMSIADEVVNVLQTFGFIFGLSDAIIGLTIFAVGNSLADLVANTSVAVFAPMMGFAACFGSPMVNILLGIGISGTYVINNSGGAPYDLHFTPTLITSTVGLLMLLMTTLVVVPMKGYVLSRRWGVFLILAYVVLMSATLAVELAFD